MRTLGKILVALLVLVVLLVGGLAVFVKYYLTEDRLKQIIIPLAEEQLGRTVAIGGIDVSIFTGITVKDFSVKEKDSTEDFLRAGGFVLRYDLMPLFSGRLDVSRILLERPFIRVTRDKTGTFNFETLALLSKKQAPPETKPGAAPAAGLPVALSVRSVAVKDARLEVRDAKGEIPEIDGSADLELSLAVGKDLASLTYKGKAGFAVDLRHGTLAPSATGTVKIDMSRLDYSVDMQVDDQKLTADGNISNYRTTPAILLNVSSKALSIDRLLALASALPKGTEGPAPATAAAPAGPVGEAIPAGLTFTGTVRIDTTTYRDLAVKDFLADFVLEKGILTVKKLSADVADGTVASTAKADLTKPGLAWNGDLKMNSVELAELVRGLQPDAAGTLEGAMDSDLAFNGTGTAWPVIRNALNLTGTYGVKNLVIRAPITEGVATLLGLSELREMKFEKADGNVRVEGGILRLKSKMGGERLSADAVGDIGLDGKLDLPVALHISEELGQALRGKAALSKYLIAEKGPSTLRLKIAGTLQSPRPTVDEKAVQKKVEEEVGRKAGELIEGVLSGKKDKPQQQEGEKTEGEQQAAPEGKKETPAEQLIKGIFGN